MPGAVLESQPGLLGLTPTPASAPSAALSSEVPDAAPRDGGQTLQKAPAAMLGRQEEPESRPAVSTAEAPDEGRSEANQEANSGEGIHECHLFSS